MTSGVIRDDRVPTSVQAARCGRPGVSVLTTAVQEQHNGAGSVVPVAIRREGDAVCGAESLERNGHRVRSPL